MNKTSQRLYPHIHNGRFYNYKNEIPEGFFFRSLYIYLKSHVHRFFHHSSIYNWKVRAHVSKKSMQPVITWIGHSTFLIQIAGVNILTDPIFGDATSLFPRIIGPGIELAHMPPVDLVLISHNHLDHMDAQALSVLKDKYPSCRYAVPMGDKQWFDKRGFDRVEEYTWWQQSTHTIHGTQLNLHFLPAFHWSQRGFFDKNRSLWGSWMIEIAGQRIYFAGDTAYARHFKMIGQEFDRIDCAIMPIGPCEPHKWMKFSHVNAQEAYQGFRDLGAAHFIPMHWGTFYFGTDTFDTPLRALQEVWKAQAHEVQADQLHLIKIGQTIPLPQHVDPAQVLPEKDIQP